jgi:hypothetical protein
MVARATARLVDSYRTEGLTPYGFRRTVTVRSKRIECTDPHRTQKRFQNDDHSFEP